MKKTAQILFLALSVMALGCGKKEKPKPYNIAILYSRYVEDNASFYAEASLRKDSAFVQVNDGITINGKRMQAVNLGNYGIKYRLNEQMKFPERCEFVFNADKVKDTIQYFVDFLSCKKVKLPEMTLDKKVGINLSWEGLPLTATENLRIMLIDGKGETHQIGIVGPTKEAGIMLGPDKVVSIAAGAGKVSVIRKNSRQFTTKDSKVYADTEYYSKDQKLTIKE